MNFFTLVDSRRVGLAIADKILFQISKKRTTLPYTPKTKTSKIASEEKQSNQKKLHYSISYFYKPNFIHNFTACIIHNACM